LQKSRFYHETPPVIPNRMGWNSLRITSMAVGTHLYLTAEAIIFWRTYPEIAPDLAFHQPKVDSRNTARRSGTDPDSSGPLNSMAQNSKSHSKK
jgi:hypothetical protein